MAAEGVRRGPARAGPLHRAHPGPGRDRGGHGGEAADSSIGSTICSCPSSRATPRRVYECSPEPAVLRRLRLLQDYPTAVHPRSEDRHALRGHHAHPGARPVLPQDRARQGAGAGAPRAQIAEFAKADPGDAAGSPPERELLGRALDDVQEDRRPYGRRPMTTFRGRGPAQHLQGRSEHHPAGGSRRVTWSSAGCCCASRGRARPPRRDPDHAGHGVSGKNRRGAGSLRLAGFCQSSPRSGAIAEATDTFRRSGEASADPHRRQTAELSSAVRRADGGIVKFGAE